MAQTVVSAVRDVLGLAGGRNKRLCIDSLTFQLYNKVTTGLFLLTSVVATSRQVFGEPIKCDAGTVS